MRFVWLVLAILLVASPAQAQRMMVLGAGGPFTAAAAGYTGPGDIVSGATAFYGLRAYNAAYAATPGKSVNVRRASDNVACDINVATTGGLGLTTATCNSSTQGGITYSAFVGTDATASCTIAGTSAACTGASATIHVGDPVTGVGITNPCVVTATNGSTTATVSLAGPATTCGTVSVAETVTFQVAGFTTEAYDQTGTGNNVTQATAGNQPQFLPLCVSGLPCLRGSIANTTQLNGTISSVSQPISFSSVFLFDTGSCTSNTCSIISTFTGPGIQFLVNNSPFLQLYGGAFASSGSLSLNTFYAAQGLANSATSKLETNGTLVTGLNASTNALSTSVSVMGRPGGGFVLDGYFCEGGIWPSDTSASWTALNGNERTYWGI